MTPAEFHALADEANRHATEYADKDYPSIIERYARFRYALHAAAEQAEQRDALVVEVQEYQCQLHEQAERLERLEKAVHNSLAYFDRWSEGSDAGDVEDELRAAIKEGTDA